MPLLPVSVLYVEKNQNTILRNILRFLTSRFRQIVFLMTCQQHKNSNAISKRLCPIVHTAANLRSLRMTNANTLTTKSTSLSFKRNLKSRRVYFQMSNPLILYAKKSMALVE